MKKTIRLTESDLVRLVTKVIDEQNTKCPNKKATKQVIDSKLPIVQKRLDSFLNSDINKLIKNLDEEYQSLIKSEISKHKNKLLKINQNQLYSKFGIIPQYNPTSDATIIMNDLFKILMNKIDGNFFKRQLVKAYVNKDNVKEIKEEASDFLNSAFSVVYRAIHFPQLIGSNKIKELYPVCSNGESSVETKPILTFETDLLKKNMLNTINKKLNSYV